MDTTQLWIAGATAALGGMALYMHNNRPKLPPGPTWLPILGTWDFINMDESTFHLWLTENGNKYGDLFTVYMGKYPVIILNSYEVMREAFVSKGVETGGRSVIDDRVKVFNPHYPERTGIIDGPITEEWKKQRNVTVNLLRSLGMGKHTSESRLQDEADVLVNKLKETDQAPVDFASLIYISISNVICSLLFGKRYDHDDKELIDMMQNLSDVLEGFVVDSEVVTIPWLKHFKPKYEENREKHRKAGNTLATFIRTKVEEGKKKLADGEEPSDFVTHYLAEVAKIGTGETRITEDWLQLTGIDFFIAGSETTATSMLWAIMFMAKNQDIQKKVQHEMDSVGGKAEYRFSLSDRERLPYVEATIMEVQRRGSIAPVGVPHRTTKDVQLGGYTIPKGTEMWANIYGILNTPKTWDSPAKFMPERFLGEDGKLQRHDHWVPFSMGRRTCLGEQLARQELFIVFSHILHRFSISFPEGEPEPSDQGVFYAVLKPETFKVCFKPRF